MNTLAPRPSRLLGFCLALAAAAAGGAPVTAPEVSLSLRGTEDGTVEAGEPFRVAVRIGAATDTEASYQLAPATGSWIEATTVEILATDGRAVAAATRPASAPADRVTTVDADNSARGLWLFPADTLGAITPGDYTVRATLVIHDGPGWQGTAESEPAPLRVVAATSDPARATTRVLGRANAALLEGAPAKAAALLDAMLETDPDNVPLLSLRAAVCLEGGHRSAARACIDRTLALATRSADEPSALLHALAERIEAAADQGGVAGPLPPWATPPRSVFAPRHQITAEDIGAPERSTTATKAPVPAVSVPAASPSAGASLAAAAVPLPAPAGKSAGAEVVAAAECNDAVIGHDSAGQWAVAATASSQYGSTQYSAGQATGAPDIAVAGDSPNAWCPASQSQGTAWLEVSFASPVHATELRVRQSNAPGAIVRIDAIDLAGVAHLWWEGTDPYVAPAVRDIVWFAVRVPRCPYLVSRMKITLNLAAVPGWKQIDAVQLVGAPE
jgi:hypothetical protein